jgi:phosphatidylinositol alpha 1,6-mannosyltransferase
MAGYHTRMALRVAIVCGNYTAVADGVGLTTQRQAAFLLQAGDVVRVYAPIGPASELAPAVPVVPVPALHLRGFPYAVGYRLPSQDLAEFRPDVLHFTTPDAIGWWAARWARRRRVPVLATYHTHFPSYLNSYRVPWLEPAAWCWLRACYTQCNTLIVGSGTLAAELDRQRVRPVPQVITPGVDLTRFGPEHRSHAWRLAHGFAPGDVVVAYVGRLAPEKSLDVFAKVCLKLQHDGIRHRVLIVGEGPEEHTLRQVLNTACYTGRLSGMELARAFASADLLLFPSVTETFGCVTAEALASGLAVVVADSPGSRDIVRNGVDGLVCKPGDVNEFAAAVAMLIRDANERRRLQQSGPGRAAEFGWPRVLEQFRAVLHEAATTGRGTSRSAGSSRRSGSG